MIIGLESSLGYKLIKVCSHPGVYGEYTLIVLFLGIACLSYTLL